MSERRPDRELGLDRAIPRRDFLDGIALGTAGMLLSPLERLAGAYQYNSLFDPFWLENGEPPCARARRPFGLLAIANADSAAYAYTDAAIDQAYRAVQEILPRRG